jgi:hypothetical protein
MFNELLTRPVTESGFNSINPKIDENKRSYIYSNGVKFVPVSQSPSNGGTYLEGPTHIIFYANSSILDSVSSTGFATTSKISLAGYSRIWFKLIITIGDNYYKGGVNLFVDESVRYCYDIGNTSNPQAYTRYTSSIFSNPIPYIFGSIDISLLDQTKTYYVGVNAEHWNVATYFNYAAVNEVYLEK